MALVVAQRHDRVSRQGQRPSLRRRLTLDLHADLKRLLGTAEEVSEHRLVVLEVEDAVGQQERFVLEAALDLPRPGRLAVGPNQYGQRAAAAAVDDALRPDHRAAAEL